MTKYDKIWEGFLVKWGRTLSWEFQSWRCQIVIIYFYSSLFYPLLPVLPSSLLLRLPQLLSILWPSKDLTPHPAWQRWEPWPEEWQGCQQPDDASGLQHLQAEIILISPLSFFKWIIGFSWKIKSFKGVTQAVDAHCRQEKVALI